MNDTIWSTCIQGAEMLYMTRNIRFRDEYRAQYLKAMSLENGMNILEVGCGSGLLCHRLKEWLPGSNITGLDMDANFIKYAREKSIEKGFSCTFVQGDATSLPFKDNSYDACTSHTVIEHIPTIPFLSEQFRVCRPGGVVSVISSRTEASISPENPQPVTDEEQELWNRVRAASKDCDKNNKVCAYPCSVTDIPRYMEDVGFINVSVDFIAVTAAPGSAQYNIAAREEFIETNRRVAQNAILLAKNYAPGIWSENEVNRLRELVNKRFDDRTMALREGRKIWDIAVSMLMITRGYKPE